jgi:uncharacterized protein (UPF0332 family)
MVDMVESKQDVVTINNIDSNALEQFINYSYNGKITITNDNVQSLLVAANFFHLQTIKNACSDFSKILNQFWFFLSKKTFNF